MVQESLFLLGIVLGGAGLSVGAALWYLGRFPIERPPIGVLTSGDVFVLSVGIFALPFLYLRLPVLLFSFFLFVGLIALLFIGFQPVFRGGWLWLWLGLCVAALWGTFWMARQGWFIGAVAHWMVNDVLIVLVAVSASNVYVQSGMRLRHVAWFLVAFTAYDALFAFLFPTTRVLTTALTDAVFQPFFGLVLGPYRATLGLGDLLAFALFVLCAHKGYGRSGTILALLLTALFGALLPALFAVLFSGPGAPFFPVQVSFGPVAVGASCWLLWHAPERSTAAWRRACDRLRAQP